MGKVKEKTKSVRITETESKLLLETINATAYLGSNAELIAALKAKLKFDDE